MDFSEEIVALADRSSKIRANLTTEEATKTALVLPFIRVLGYDVFNPVEVVPEFIADIAGRKGEKVDYAIMHEGKPIILIECKPCGTDLDADKHEQLHRYFTTVDARIGILTDGIKYLFFSDLEENKRLDSRPFMEFRLDNIDKTLIQELRKLSKGKFDLKEALESAWELKYNREIKNILLAQLEAPSDGLVDFFIKETYSGRATKGIREAFMGYVKRAFSEFVAEQIDNRLKTALAATPKKEEAPPPPSVEPEIRIATTEAEWQAFYIIKAALAGLVDTRRIVMRDSVNFCSILLDDTNRKPLAKLFFNNPDKLSIELYPLGARVSHEISSIDDIINFTDEIKATLKHYSTPAEPQPA